MRKLFNRSTLPFWALFLVMFVMHLGMDYGADDLWFYAQLDTQSMGEFLSLRYDVWSSRLIIEAVLVVLTHWNIYVWRVLDSALYALGAYVSLKLVNRTDEPYVNIAGCLGFMMYPYSELSSAGWAATTLNYLWPFSLGMLSFLPLIYTERGQKCRPAAYILSGICLIYGANQEQMCALLFAFHALYFLRGLKLRYRSKYNIVCLLLCTASLVFILTCPGNSARMVSETATWYPEFADFGILEKIYLGVVPTADILISDKTILFALSVILADAVFAFAGKRMPKLIAAVFLLAVSCATVLRPLFTSALPIAQSFFDLLEYGGVPGSEWSIYAICGMWFVFGFAVVLCLCIVYLLFIVFGTEQLLPQFVFLGGVCSRFIMGWSPTVFASGARTALFLYMALLIVCAALLYKLYAAGEIAGRYKTLLLLPAGYVGLINFCESLYSLIIG